MKIQQLLITLLVASALSCHAQSFVSGNYKFRIVDPANGKVELSAFTGTSIPQTLVIPSTVSDGKKEYSVTEIGVEAFANCSNIKTVVFPTSIEYIAEYAFKGCPIEEIYLSSPEAPIFIGKDPLYNFCIDNIKLRDPFIVADRKTHAYYTYLPRWDSFGYAEIECYKSYDLHNWKSMGLAYRSDENFLGNCDNWAPDCYEYNGNYYLFTTFARAKDKSKTDHWNLNNFEIMTGTAVFKSENGPSGPFHATAPEGVLNATPADMMCIDGSLYVDDNGDPWMIYSGELTQFYNGRVYAQRMTPDLVSVQGEPQLLFVATDSRWSCNSGVQNGRTVYITDAPLILKDSETGNLIMTWSSNSSTGYAIGQAISESGNVLGPWKHEPVQINTDNGGHSMFFRTFDDRLMLSYHTTENSTIQENMCIYEVKIENGKIKNIDHKNDFRITGSDVRSSFDQSVMDNATVFITRDYYVDYRLGEMWSKFKKLKLGDYSGVDNVSCNENAPFELRGTHLIIGDGNTDICVASTDGRVLASGRPDALSLQLTPGTVYIVKYGTKTTKIIAKN